MKAKARHILVSKFKRAKSLKLEIENGSSFEELAKLHSTCPSGKQGGDLGTFSPGEMVKAFDKVVFKEKLNTVHGPIRTEFGYHLIEILERG
jgi:peptidyl-prolyl cis-trans isomerase C